MDPPSINAFGAIWGPPLIGTFVAAVIYGITVLQTFHYYTHYQLDRIFWKNIVAVIFVLDTAAIALDMHAMYYYLVLSWGLPEMTAPDVHSLPTEYVLTSLLTFVVQLFYINTVRALEAPIVVLLLLLTFSATALVSGLFLPEIQVRLHFIQVIVDDNLNHVAFNIARSTALACDLGVVVSLFWLLRERTRNTTRAKNLVNTILIFTVQRGVLQAVIQAGEVLAYAIRPNSIYFLPFHIIVSRIYCASVLATLNSRDYIARRGDLPGPGSTKTAPVLSTFFSPPFLFDEQGTTQTIQTNVQNRVDSDAVLPPHTVTVVYGRTRSGAEVIDESIEMENVTAKEG